MISVVRGDIVDRRSSVVECSNTRRSNCSERIIGRSDCVCVDSKGSRDSLVGGYEWECVTRYGSYRSTVNQNIRDMISGVRGDIVDRRSSVVDGSNTCRSNCSECVVCRCDCVRVDRKCADNGLVGCHCGEGITVSGWSDRIAINGQIIQIIPCVRREVKGWRGSVIYGLDSIRAYRAMSTND